MKIKRLVFLSMYIFVVFLLAILPFNNSDTLIKNTFLRGIRLDHIVHALLFFPWMFFLTLFPEKKIIVRVKLSAINWFFGGILLAFGAEAVQYFVSYRSYTIPDLLFNIIGLVIGWLFISLFKKVLKLKIGQHRN